MTNTGNTPAQFTVEIVDPDDEVDFTLTSSTSVLIGAGFSDGVKVQRFCEDAAADGTTPPRSSSRCLTVPSSRRSSKPTSARWMTWRWSDASLDDDAGSSGVQHNAIPGRR